MAETIKDLIQKLARDEFRNEQIYSLPCKVLSIDESDYTVEVEPLNGDAEIPDARIQTDLGASNGLKMIPEIGSNVMVTFMNKNTGYISLYSDVKSYQYKKDSISLVIDSDGIVYNDGTNGGACNVPTLRVELNKTIARITALEGLILAFGSAQSTVAGSIPIFAPLIPAWSGLSAGMGALPPQGAYNTNIEDEKVKH